MLITLADNFKYLVINSGYTSRLHKKVKKINEEILNQACIDEDEDDTAPCVLYIKDKLWGKGMYEFGNVDDIAYVEKQLREKYSINLDGIIVFRCNALLFAFEIIGILKECHFCGCFGYNNIYKMTCIDNEILVIEIDAESG